MDAMLCDVCEKPLRGLSLRLKAWGPFQMVLGADPRAVDLCEEHAAACVEAINLALDAQEQRARASLSK